MKLLRLAIAVTVIWSVLGAGLVYADRGSPPTMRVVHRETHKYVPPKSTGNPSNPQPNSSFNGGTVITCDELGYFTKPTNDSVTASADDYCTAVMSYLFIQVDIQYQDPFNEEYGNMGGAAHVGYACIPCDSISSQNTQVSASNLIVGSYRVHYAWTENPPSGYSPPSGFLSADEYFFVNP